MRIYEDERTNDWVLKMMKEKLEREPRTGAWHASELFGCPRKAILSRETPRSLTKSDVLYFTRGYAIQNYMFGEEAEGEEHWGIILSPDHIEGDHLFEIKTTNFWRETKSKGKFDPTNMSDWITRTTTYAAAFGKKVAHITVVFLNGPTGIDMATWTLEFSDTDLEDAKTNLEIRRDNLIDWEERYEATNKLPSVTERSYERECSFCPHLAGCLAELTAAGMSVEK